MILHNYFRSSTSIRLRVVLGLKQLEFTQIAYDLRAGEHREAGYLAINPQGLVPALDTGTQILTQSLAIIEYLDEVHPHPPLLPADPAGRARVRALAQQIGCDIHPVNNLRVLNALRSQFGASEATVTAWFRHWATTGLDAMETDLSRSAETGRFCHGDQPGLADVCLFAQLVNNKRFGLEDDRWPTLARIQSACLDIQAFQKALPEVS